MIIVGLTGSIGMGKSTAAAMFRRMGVPVIDSDAIVHKLLGPGGAAIGPIGEAFKGVVVDNAVDRPSLGQQVFADPAALKRLEAILHPLVQEAQAVLLARAACRRVAMVVLDVPLLFEVGTAACCDAVIVVTAPRFLQEQRVLGRPGMTREKLDGALARQMPDSEKRRRADFVVQSGIGRQHTLNRLREIVTLMSPKSGTHWPPRCATMRKAYARSRS
ncbi:MAG: dephospho-CoA kinase [Rhodospirillaceae bacterium]|nr:dephospho-CoA kinase [Rhodospirillaceae bacterium]MBT5455669.1 dephospho-CoA kinase [Rhodospirillaceae bacterium]